jgi:hypothetical protein
MPSLASKMFNQNDIIQRVPIHDYFQLSPTEHTIYHSHLQSGTEYVLTVKIKNDTNHVLGWRIRTKKNTILDYKPVIKASCIAPKSIFDCKIVVAVKKSTKERLLESNKVDEFQIQGTVLPSELQRDELDAVLLKRTKMQDKKRKLYVYQEELFKCNLLLEPIGPGFPAPPTTIEHEPQLLLAGKNTVGWHETYATAIPLSSQSPPITNPKAGFVKVLGSELRNLRQKAKQYDELRKQVTKIMKERDEYQLKLNEQCTQSILMWKRLSSSLEELRKLKDVDSGDEIKTDGYAKKFFEDLPKEQLSDFKQPTSISLSMAIGGVVFAAFFYMIGKNSGS